MRIVDTQPTDTYTVNAKLDSISRYISTRNGRITPIIIIHTDRGNYSAFENIWQRQRLTADQLTEGDLLEITYTIHRAANGVEYKNFVQVRKIDMSNHVRF